MKKTYNNYRERVEAKKNNRTFIMISILSLIVLIGIGYAFLTGI